MKKKVGYTADPMSLITYIGLFFNHVGLRGREVPFRQGGEDVTKVFQQSPTITGHLLPLRPDRSSEYHEPLFMNILNERGLLFWKV